ncbi:hypothetical protein X738_11665 [Mesorhizobium sp. LNHC209A00]|nr:hypothetical protein X738_11665 [Mesorhizobium sp. LNHC209A00]
MAEVRGGGSAVAFGDPMTWSILHAVADGVAVLDGVQP